MLLIHVGGILLGGSGRSPDSSKFPMSRLRCLLEVSSSNNRSIHDYVSSRGLEPQDPLGDSGHAESSGPAVEKGCTEGYNRAKGPTRALRGVRAKPPIADGVDDHTWSVATSSGLAASFGSGVNHHA